MTPHEQMAKLDAEGTSYQVHGSMRDEHSIHRSDVLHHSETWLCLKYPDENEPYWVNMAHVMRLTIEEV